MNSFDPFISSQYKYTQKDDTPLQSDIYMTKKTESQFLSEILSYSFSSQNKDFVDHTESCSILKQESENQSRLQTQQRVAKTKDYGKNSSKNSPFHNFQKHLVITLRQNLKLESLKIKAGFEAEIAQQIFIHFKNSQKTSRKFLEQIYGLYDIKDQQSGLEFIRNIKKGELEYIIGNLQNKTIIEAQKILRQLTTIQLQESDFQQVLAHRKIEKKRQFIEYVNLFKRELVEGKQRKKTYKALVKKFNNN